MKSQEMLRIVGWLIVGLTVLVGSGTVFFSNATGSDGGVLLLLISGGIIVGGLAVGAPFLALADLLDKMDRQHAAIKSLHRTLALQGHYTSEPPTARTAA